MIISSGGTVVYNEHSDTIFVLTPDEFTGVSYYLDNGSSLRPLCNIPAEELFVYLGEL